MPVRLRRWIQRRRLDQRALLADDVRRVAGYADAVVTSARRLGLEVPERVAGCAALWRSWSDRLHE